MTFQVEMEFKKHRQGAILDGLKALKSPESIQRPGLFSDAATSKALQKDLKNAEKRVNKMKERLRRALDKPTIHDPVYKICQRCFHKEDALTLQRESKEKILIRKRALRRFLHGCPPRKATDTSMGDAVNWEWIISCAAQNDGQIHIVSRDSDYGAVFENRAYLNDHLLQEFKERVSRKRKIYLHSKLSDALKNFAIAITPEEEKEEEEIAQKPPAKLSGSELTINELISILGISKPSAEEIKVEPVTLLSKLAEKKV